ncbi:MAG TPA: 4Fe-4S dicluster domain-containing protein [Bryobacteraceae bacterium]|nr:4Fe-4S dicluster domain-containing protein [Bryobacteraceae bacterium]HOQ44842.1 4Fe-4S dicluster domain-containing protein [Bryobacteraceae bacterium]HPU72147.1 4Fe-4S dicluster domain-containing protein [Bryobacteraceae bacterium]
MSATLPATGSQSVIEFSALTALISALRRRGYEVIGPVVRDGAVTLEAVEKVEDLPVGWGDEQESGHYRLKRREDNAVFGYTVGPQGWKRFLHPPEVPLLEAQRDNSSFRILKKPPAPVRYAFLGVRACELAAIRILDRVFLGDRYVEPGYKGRREAAFLIAVNCTKAGGTCFCTSMGTGPRAASGFDLALTELPGREGHRFVVEVGSEAGAAVLGEIEHRKAREEEVREAQAAVDNAAGQMRRAVDTEGIRDVLFDNFEHPRWDRVAARCLSCANCTMVCPTCFCTTVEDVTDIAGDRAERWRKWDSCFTDGFSYIHGGSVRLSVKSRYRQWLTHKFAAWVDQFGTFGCVGCGRCITWCPGRIDITEELRAMRGVEASA